MCTALKVILLSGVVRSLSKDLLDDESSTLSGVQNGTMNGHSCEGQVVNDEQTAPEQ